MNIENPIKLGAGAIVVRNGMMLLAKRKNTGFGDGSWGSFGGHVEFGESVMKAVEREAREELGIEIGNLRFLYCANIVRDGKHFFDMGFIAELISGEPHICDPDHIDAVGWFPLDALPSPLFEPIKFALEAYNGGAMFHDFNERNP